MKNLFLIFVFALLLAGCKDNSPTQVSMSDEDFFSQESMENSVLQISNSSSTLSHHNSGSIIHDSLRHGNMLLKLKVYLNLSDAQFDSLKVYGKILIDELKAIREKVKTGEITRDEAKVLVKVSRDKFVASFNSVLTDEQKVKFARWATRFWHRHRGGRP